MIEIRHAREADLGEIVAIYNASIPGRMSTADTVAVSVESRRGWYENHGPRRPLFVAVEKCGVGVSPMMSNRSMGVSPMKSEHERDAHATGNHEQDAHATGVVHIRRGASLPHWTREGAIYAVTFRLADSLPRSVRENWERERGEILQRARSMGRGVSDEERRRLDELHTERMEQYLDSGAGACWMKDVRVARVVADALLHFDGVRYELDAWCVMPNHVHAVVRPYVGHPLPEIMHTWKSFTAKEANRILGRTGEFWQRESYDHLVRDEEDFHHCVDYALKNPMRAGLIEWSWCGSSPRSMGVSPMKSEHERDAHATGNHEQDAHATGHHERDAHATGHHERDAHATGHHERDAHATGEQVVGYLSMRHHYGRPAYHITAEIGVYVHPEHFRKGVASKLLRHAIDACPSIGVEVLLAIAFAHNGPSIGFFKRYGFVERGRLPGVADLDGKRVDVVYMVKALRETHADTQVHGVMPEKKDEQTISRHFVSRDECGAPMNEEPFMDAVVQMVQFLELSDSQVVNEDAAIEMMEQIAATLKKLGPAESELFLAFLKRRASEEGSSKERQFIENLAANLGLLPG